jgi:signal-transduction protein with cAMP-binding, CBS, and nucleotidyltransferase domain
MLDRVSISDIPLFSGLSRSQLDRVRQLIRIATYQRGEIVIEEGAPADYLLFIIIDGEAALNKKGALPLNRPPLRL